MTDIERRLRDAMRAAVDGEPPPPGLVAAVRRRHRRYLARMTATTVVAVVVAAAVPAALAARLAEPGNSRPGASRPATPAISATPGRSSRSASPSPSGSAGDARRHAEPHWLRGLPLRKTTDLRLLLAGPDPAWLSSATGSIETIAGLPRSSGGGWYDITSLQGGWTASLVAASPACANDCPGARATVYFIADGGTAARRVGLAQEVAPGAGSTTMWLETYPRASSDVATTPVTAQQVTDTGQRVGRPVRLPAGYVINQGVGSDLLLTPVSQGPGSVIDELWDPGTGRTVRTFAGVIAAGPTMVAWGICVGCSVHVLDVTTGASFTIAVPKASWAYNGIFSAGERLLAVCLSAGVTSTGAARLQEIAVIDIAARSLRIIKGSSVSTEMRNALNIGWAGRTDQLVAVVTGGGRPAQVAYWQPGNAGLRVARLLQPAGTSIVVGPYG
jgi:hypothetical protein